MLPAMKITHVAALILSLCAVSACTPSVQQNTASVQPVDGKVIGTMRGEGGILGVQGDLVKVMHGSLSINGQFIGTVPKICEIKYIVDGERRTLYVDGKQRELPPIPPPPAQIQVDA